MLSRPVVKPIRKNALPLADRNFLFPITFTQDEYLSIVPRVSMLRNCFESSMKTTDTNGIKISLVTRFLVSPQGCTGLRTRVVMCAPVSACVPSKRVRLSAGIHFLLDEKCGL